MKTKSHSISGAFVFTLLGAFAVFSMLLVVLGAQAYRTTVDGASAHTRKRIAAAFVRNAVRAQDERGAIAVEDRDGLPVLVLSIAAIAVSLFAGLAYYVIWSAAVLLFVLAVWYTVKML